MSNGQYVCTESNRLSRIEKTCDRIDRALNGNGEPGIKIKVHDLEAYRDAEIARRDEIKLRSWALIMLLLSNIVLTFFLFLRELIMPLAEKITL